MVTTVISTLTDTQSLLGTSDNYILLEGVTHYTTGSGNAPIEVTGSNVDIHIYGHLLTLDTSDGIDLGSTSNVVVHVGGQGSITTADGYRPIDSLGADVTLINDGSISGGQMELDGADNAVLNTGMITGQLAGTSSVAALQMGGANAQLENSGTIQSLSDWGVEFRGNAYVFNSGTITGADTAISAQFLNDAEEFYLNNTGVIGGGTNALVTGAGDDTVINLGTLAGDVSLGSGDDLYKASGAGVTSGTIDMGGGLDTVRGGQNSETVDGGAGDDLIYGAGGEDDLNGGSDADTIFGGSGEDILDGGAGLDVVNGGTGEDQVIGGLDRDLLTGGSGADVFVYETQLDSATGSGNNDTIYDFKRGVDQIDLDALFVGDFEFIGTGSFTGGRQVRYTDQGDRSYIILDSDGDGSGDMRIVVLNVTEWTAEDFIL